MRWVRHVFFKVKPGIRNNRTKEYQTMENQQKRHPQNSASFIEGNFGSIPDLGHSIVPEFPTVGLSAILAISKAITEVT